MLDKEKEHLITVMYQYHPPVTLSRIERHSLINKVAELFALVAADVLQDGEFFLQVNTAIQQARMVANQYITVEEVLGGGKGEEENQPLMFEIDRHTEFGFTRKDS